MRPSKFPGRCRTARLGLFEPVLDFFGFGGLDRADLQGTDGFGASKFQDEIFHLQLGGASIGELVKPGRAICSHQDVRRAAVSSLSHHGPVS